MTIRRVYFKPKKKLNYFSNVKFTVVSIESHYFSITLISLIYFGFY